MPRKKPKTDPESFLPLSPAAFHVLVALAGGERHGWAIMKEVAQRTEQRIRLSPGTLYGLIKRMLDQGLIGESDVRPPSQWDDERRRYYALTDLGRRVAEAEAERMRRALELASGADLLGPAPQEA